MDISQFNHMKKFTIIILFFCQLSFSQTATNQIDSNGKRHGQWLGYYEDTKHLKYEGQFEHGQEVGTFTYYDNTKAKKVIATRVFNPKDQSAYTTFFNGKFKVSEGKVVNKQYEGEWKYYHKDMDAIMTLEYYKVGKLEGVRKVFYKSGEIAEEASYKNGVKEGSYKKYAENGVVLEESNFKAGNYNGPTTVRDVDGKILTTGQYKNGKSVGIWKFYENGKLVKEENRSLKKPAKPKSTNPAPKRNVKEMED